MRRSLLIISVMIVVVFLPIGVLSSSASAATLNVVNGELMGATGVDVGGTLYDVTFMDGTCIGLFGGCDESTDFTFPTWQEAAQASWALLNQVFLDTPLGNFDSVPGLTFGIDPGAQAAFVMTPWVYNSDPFMVGLDIAKNWAPPNNDQQETWESNLGLNTDTTDAGYYVYAIWSDPTPVPAPTTMLLLGSGLIGLAGLKRKFINK